MLKAYFQISFTNDLFCAKEKMNSVLDYLKNNIPNLTEDDLFALRVIYGELIANAIIHGNKQDLSKKVQLIIEINDNIISSIVRDEGCGFDYSRLLKSRETPDDVFFEHGRGLKIVLFLADSVKWNDIGNEIIFCKKFNITTKPLRVVAC